MIDAFLEVAYDHHLKQSESVKLARVLSALPEEDLRKLVTGEVKLAFGDCAPDGEDRTWLGKYKGTPLFDQALALEKADLEAEVARTQARAAEPPWETMNKTQDQIRMQKKMLDLDLVELENNGGQSRGPDQPMSVIPDPATQGAGAMGDAGPDAEPQKQEKAAEAFLKAAISGGMIERAVMNTAAKGALTPDRVSKAKALGDKLVNKGSNMIGNFSRGAKGTVSAPAMSLVRQGGQMSNLMGKLGANFAQAAMSLAKANPKLVGAGLGAVGGAIAGGPDHRLSGAAGGAALGAAGGHAAHGIGMRMAGPGAKGFADAAQGYGNSLAAKAKGMLGKGADPAQYAVTPSKPPLPAAASPSAHGAQALDMLDLTRGQARPRAPLPAAPTAPAALKPGAGNVQQMPAVAR